MGEGVSRRRGEGAGMSWAWDNFMWVGVWGTFQARHRVRERWEATLADHTAQIHPFPAPALLAPATSGAQLRLTLVRGHLRVLSRRDLLDTRVPNFHGGQSGNGRGTREVENWLRVRRSPPGSSG